jgi:GTPase SAR1 family protein
MAIRVALIGTDGSGKTEIMRRLSGEAFRPAYYPTWGTETWNVTIENLSFIVTEYSGQEQLLNVPQEELDAITAYILVTVDTRLGIRSGRRLQAKLPDVPHCVVMNKTDVYPTNHAFKCCAKTNDNLDAPFLRIAQLYEMDSDD